MALSPLVGFLRNRVLSTIIGFGAGGAISAVFDPAVRPLKHELEEKTTTEILSPAELAEAVIRGLQTEEDAAGEAAKSGLDSGRFKTLVNSTGNPPGPGELIELWRRGVIDQARVELGIREGRFRTEWTSAYLAFKRNLLSAADLASMVVQGVLQHGEAEVYAGQLGFEPDDFERLVKLNGNPPGAGELFQLWNRGVISDADVDRGLLQSRLKPEWTGPIKELAKVIPPISDLIRFAVREVYSPDVRSAFGQDADFPAILAAEAAKHGLDPEQAGNYWAAHWDLPSPQQGFAMLHRGVISDAQLDLLLRSLDVMPFWREKLKQIARIVPGRIDLRRMFKEGTIDRERVKRGYLDLGYSAEDAELLTHFAEQEKLSVDKDLAKGELATLYQDRAISEAQFKGFLNDLGYDDQEAGFLVDLADLRRAKAIRSATISVVRGRFLARQIDVGEASQRLDRIGLSPDERDQYLDLWTFQREESPHLLSEAQIRAAWKAGVVDEGAYRAYLAQLGYADPDAEILVKLYAPKA